MPNAVLGAQASASLRVVPDGGGPGSQHGGPGGDPAPTLPPAPAGSAIVDTEWTSLVGGGSVATYMTADSHSLVADYAVFDRHGDLVAAGSIPGYSTSVAAVPLSDGGFVLADAQSDLFGLHSTLSVELFSRWGAPMSAPTVVDTLSSAAGGAGIQQLSGQAAQGVITLSFTAYGAPEHMTMDLTGPDGVFSASPSTPGHPAASSWG